MYIFPSHHIVAHLSPKKLCSSSERRSLLNSINFCSLPIPTNRFAGIARSKFWLKCISCSSVRLLNACEWISFILLAARFRIWRCSRCLKWCTSMSLRKLFFIDKYCRCKRLSKASDATCTRLQKQSSCRIIQLFMIHDLNSIVNFLMNSNYR